MKNIHLHKILFSFLHIPSIVWVQSFVHMFLTYDWMMCTVSYYRYGVAESIVDREYMEDKTWAVASSHGNLPLNSP